MSNDVRGFWKKKKKPNPSPPTPEVSQEDHATVMTVTKQLKDLKEDAAREKLTLKGTLNQRTGAVEQALDNRQYTRAEGAMNTLRVDFDKAVVEKQAWVQQKNDYDETKAHVDVLTNWETPTASRRAEALAAIDTRVTQEKFSDAGKLLKVLKPAAENDHTEAVKRRSAQVAFNSAYGAVSMKLDDPAMKIPDSAPAQLKDDRKDIDTDHQAVLDKRNQGEYKQAEDLLPALSDKIDKLIAASKVFSTAKNKLTKDYNAVAERIQALLTMDDDIPDDKRALKKEVVDLHKDIEDKKKALDFAGAQISLDDLKNNKLVPLETFKTAHDDAKAKFQKAWPAYKYQAEEIINYPQNRAPDSLKNLQKAVKDAYDPIVADLGLRKYFEAEAGIAALKAAIPTALTAKRTHDKAMREYYAALKTLRPRIAAANKVAAPPDTLQPLIDDYNDALNELVAAQNSFDYPLANTKRPALETAITDLLAARKDALLADLETEDDPDKVATAVQKLAPEEIAELGAMKQLAFLKKLRTNPDDSPHPLDAEGVKARNLLYDSIPLDEDFVKEDRKKREKIIGVFRKDKKFIKAEKDWKTMSDDDRKEFIRYAAKKQCEVMGHPEPTITFVTERECKNDACGDKGVAKDIGAFTKVMPEPPPPKLPEYECPTCHTHPVGFDFGGCGSKLKTDPKGIKRGAIKLNTIPDAKFDDFGEQLDTIMHENAHAYQLELVYVQLETGQLKESDPEYKQAMLFLENDEAGYETDGPTYNNQPLERHSWTFGPAIRNGLVGPKVTRLGEGEI